MGIWSVDIEVISIENNVSSVLTIFKKYFEEPDVAIVYEYQEKYLLFRRETNSDLLTLQMFFCSLDEALKKLFNFFKNSDNNALDILVAKTIECKTLEEAIELSIMKIQIKI